MDLSSPGASETYPERFTGCGRSLEGCSWPLAADLRLNPGAPTTGVGTLDVAGTSAVVVRDCKPQRF